MLGRIFINIICTTPDKSCSMPQKVSKYREKHKVASGQNFRLYEINTRGQFLISWILKQFLFCPSPFLKWDFGLKGC